MPDADVGKLVYDRIARFLGDVLDMPRGLSAIGYRNEHSEWTGIHAHPQIFAHSTQSAYAFRGPF